MPYTFAHPGFTFPFKKRKPSLFSTTGLAFGSIAPDYDILLRFTNPRYHIFQYNFISIFFLVFPLAFLSAIYYHLIIRNILIEYAPITLKKQLEGYKDFNYLHYLKTNFHNVSFSILFAIFLHLILDLLSHWDAFTFEIIAWNYYTIYWIGLVYYYIALYLPGILFSLAGFYFTIAFIKNDNIRVPAWDELIAERKPRSFLFIFLSLSFLSGILKIYFSGIENGFVIDSIIIGFTNGLLISFFITPALFAIRHKIKVQYG